VTEPTATPVSKTTEFRLTGYPQVKYRWGSGHIRPAFVVITCLDTCRSAHLYGTWIREDGEQTDDPVDQLYRHDDDWPDWLRVLADQHQPGAKKPLLPKRTRDPWPASPSTPAPAATSTTSNGSPAAPQRPGLSAPTARSRSLSRWPTPLTGPSATRCCTCSSWASSTSTSTV
jgi:hypothetical protein